MYNSHIACQQTNLKRMDYFTISNFSLMNQQHILRICIGLRVLGKCNKFTMTNVIIATK